MPANAAKESSTGTALGRVVDPGPNSSLKEGGPGGRHRPAARPRAVPQLRGGRDRAWLARLVTRREPRAEFAHALARQPDDIKVVIQFAEA